MSGYQEYLRFLVTLTAVLDPFLAVPIFLSVTAMHDERARRRLANVVTITVFVVLASAAIRLFHQELGTLLPVVRGEVETARQIVLYTIALIAVFPHAFFRARSERMLARLESLAGAVAGPR